MNEQDTASVDRLLDDIDVHEAGQAAANQRRLSREAVPQWQYMTWRVDGFGDAGGTISIVDGNELKSQERPPLYEALARAGADGWELVAVTDRSRMIFKRPLVEG